MLSRRAIRVVSQRRQFNTALPKVNLASANLKLRTSEGERSAADLFKNKKTVVVSVVGAFTGVCTSQHIPSYVKNMDKFKAIGVDEVLVVAPNDHLVLKAWAESMGAQSVKMVSDADLSLAKLLDQEIDLSAAGLGRRSHRYAMLVENGEIKAFAREEKPSELKVSSADQFLTNLNSK